jgi:hypothetical protein
LIEFITGDDIYAEILMMRTYDTRTIVLLEGQDDEQALDIHVDSVTAICINSFGKPNVLRAIGIVGETNTSRVLAVVDRDWDDTIGGISSSPNLVYSEHYDLDATVIAVEGVLERIVYAHGIKERINADLEGRGDVTLISIVEDICCPIGILRYLSVSKNWELSMREFPIVEVIDIPAMGVDQKKLVQLAMARSKSATVVELDVLSALVQAHSSAVDKFYYCGGHDVRSVLAVLINKRWGGHSGRKSIGSAIRSTLSCAVLCATSLYSAVATWATANGTRVWSCEAD